MTNGPTRVPSPPEPQASTGAGLTHRGLVRERNEDAILTDPSGTLWAIADGMGGHGYGDIAADIVIEELMRLEDGPDPATTLRNGLYRANARIWERAVENGRMGATVVALMIRDRRAHVAWAGDSRAYLLRRDSLHALTRDHSLVRELVDRGELNARQAEGHPERHVVTRAVGGAPDLEVELTSVPLSRDDRLLLCSDGLTGCVDERRISAGLGSAATPEEACRELVRRALAAGAPDNVSVIAVFVGGD
jgi:serine/threonine protein phosphatase PrpC